MFFDRTGSLDVGTALREFSPSRIIIDDVQKAKDLNSKLVFSSERYLMMVDYQGAFTEELDLEVCANVGSNRISEFTQITGASSAFVICDERNIHLVSFSTKSVTKTLLASASGTAVGYGLTFLEGWRFAISTVYDSTNTIGEIKLWDMKDEAGCHSLCGNCDWISTDKGCTSCSGNSVMRLDSSCGGACYFGEYVSSPNVCSKCDSSCKTCDGGGSNQCLTCESPKVRRTDGTCQASCELNIEFVKSAGICAEICSKGEFLDAQNRCHKCSSSCNTCSKAGEDGCTSCPDGQTLRTDGSCLTTTQTTLSIYQSNYSLSVLIEGIQDSGEVSIYLRISLHAESFNFNFAQLQELIDKKYFSILTDDLDKVGAASYNKKTKLLQEDGRVSSTRLNSIEFLVYKAESPPPKNGGNLTVSLIPNQPNIRYSEEESESLIIISQTKKDQLVTILPIKGSPMKIKTGYGIALQSSVSTTKIVGGVVSVTSSIILFYSLGFMSKFFQIIEVVMNLSLVNTKLGSLIDDVIEILGSLKFPFSLPEGLFWPDYVADSHTLFWKSRSKLSIHEKQLFILCNETLMVIVYLLTWVLWLSALAVKQVCYDQGSQENEKNDQVRKGTSGRVEDDARIKSSLFPNSCNRRKDQVREIGWNGLMESKEAIPKNILKSKRSNASKQEGRDGMKVDIVKQDSMSDSFSKMQRLHEKQIMRKNKTRQNSKLEEKKVEQNEISKKEKTDENEKPKIDRIIKFLEETKKFFFSFSYFDVQFITFHELLHSDVNRMDGMWSRGAVSYTISLITLGLMIYDLRWLLRRSSTLIRKKREKIELTKEEEEEGGFFFEDIKTDPDISFSSMKFNLISMLRFSFYQMIIVSVQLSPNFQSGFLLTLQISFFIFYLHKYRKEKFFESWYPFMTFVVFETCTMVFLLLSLIFSFENVGLWFSSKLTAWLQILAATMILIAVIIEFIALITKTIENAIGIVKTTWLKCMKKSKETKIDLAKDQNSKKQKKEESEIRDEWIFDQKNPEEEPIKIERKIQPKRKRPQKNSKERQNPRKGQQNRRRRISQKPKKSKKIKQTGETEKNQRQQNDLLDDNLPSNLKQKNLKGNFQESKYKHEIEVKLRCKKTNKLNYNLDFELSFGIEEEISVQGKNETSLEKKEMSKKRPRFELGSDFAEEPSSPFYPKNGQKPKNLFLDDNNINNTNKFNPRNRKVSRFTSMVLNKRGNFGKNKNRAKSSLKLKTLKNAQEIE